MSDEDKARISAELASGKAAVGVLTPYERGTAVKEKLAELGGAASAHEVVDEAELQAAVANA